MSDCHLSNMMIKPSDSNDISSVIVMSNHYIYPLIASPLYKECFSNYP